MARVTLPLLLCALALGGCVASDGGVPTTNIRDYRITFSSATAGDQCNEAATGTADSWNERSEIYRLHWPEGEGNTSVDLYAKREDQGDDELRYFASGSFDNPLETATSFAYAGGPWSESHDAGRVTFEIEGRASVPFEGEIRSGFETYTITSSGGNADYPEGCSFLIEYEGRWLAEQPTGGQ